MGEDIKLPPYPEGLCLREDIEDYAREAVRLNAQAVPDTREMFNAGWCAAARFCDREDAVYDGLVGPGGCPVFEVAYRAALSAAQDAPAGPTRQQIIDWLDALDIEVTDKQLAGLFDVVAMETTQDAPACLSKTSDYETQSTLSRADAPQCRLAAQAVPQGWKLVPIEPTDEMVKSAHAHHEGSAYLPHSLYAAMLAAAPAAPQPAAQQGEIAWPAIPATVRRDVTMLAGYAEGSKSAEIVNTVRRVINWLNADRIAAQAQEAAPAAQAEPSDPLQGAANWLLEAIGGCNIRTLEWHLMIDSNRAERLMLAARAAQQKGVKND